MTLGSVSNGVLLRINSPGGLIWVKRRAAGMWDAAQPMDEFEPAIKALEPR